VATPSWPPVLGCPSVAASVAVLLWPRLRSCPSVVALVADHLLREPTALQGSGTPAERGHNPTLCPSRRGRPPVSTTRSQPPSHEHYSTGVLTPCPSRKLASAARQRQPRLGEHASSVLRRSPDSRIPPNSFGVGSVSAYAEPSPPIWDTPEFIRWSLCGLTPGSLLCAGDAK
jgi:hypothetical protein